MAPDKKRKRRRVNCRSSKNKGTKVVVVVCLFMGLFSGLLVHVLVYVQSCNG